MPKYILLCCLVVIHFPSNCRLANSSANTTTGHPHSTTYSEKQVHPLATWSIVSLIIISAIVSNGLLVSILSYLNNLSLEKQCMLISLYKDFVAILIVQNCVWLIVGILYTPIQNYFKFGAIQAEVVTFIIWCLIMMLLLVINVISGISCYMMKTRVIDPWGEDEGLGLNQIRGACFVLTVGFSSTMFALGLYPKIYYFFTGEDSSVLILPRTVLIFPGVLILLMISCSITSLVAKLYESPNIQSIDKIITNQITNIICFGFLPFLLAFLSVLAFEIESPNRWKIVLGVMTTTWVWIVKCHR